MSEVLEGEPPEEAKAADWAEVKKEADERVKEILTYGLVWISPRRNGKARDNRLSFRITPKPVSPPVSPPKAAPPPG